QYVMGDRRWPPPPYPPSSRPIDSFNDIYATGNSVTSGLHYSCNAIDDVDYPCYAAPVFPFESITSQGTIPPNHVPAPRKLPPPIPSLSRDSSFRPSSNLYLPKRKRSRKCVFSRLEVCLLLLVLLLLFSLGATLTFWLLYLQGYKTFSDGKPLYPPPTSFGGGEEAADPSAKNHGSRVCTSRECTVLAAFLAENLNDKVDPCDDFYEYACGNYGLNRNLAANKPLRHTISDVQARLNKQVRSLLDSPPTPKDKMWDRLAKGYYNKCEDEDTLEKHGGAAMLDVLKWVGGWPTVEGDTWKEWPHGWEKQLAVVMNKTGVNAVLLELAVTHDPSNSSRSIIELDQPKWGVGSRWPYLMGPDDPMIQNYTSLMIATAVSMGAPQERAERDMREAMELELKLVNFSAEEMVRRDPERGNNRFQLWELRNHFPLIKIDEYVRSVFDGLVHLSDNETIIIRETEYFKGIQHILKDASKRVLANYISWRIVQGFSPFLPPTAREPFYQFKANQTGMFNSPPPDRWEDCVTLSVIMMDMPVGKLFVEHFFDRVRAMTKMNELTLYLKTEFIKQLHVLDWMDDETRERAISKANAIEYKSGYPEVLFDDEWMKKQWGIPFRPDEPLLHLTIRIKLVRYAEELLRLSEPLDRSTWYQSPAQVDAYYAPNSNEMIFPAGIMQFPFLTIGVPNYITYGMVGAVIGHEVSHAFDDQGGRYDELGNLKEWWDAETDRKFQEKNKCFVHQYESVRVEEANVHLNGQLSLGENIADNGGVKTAFNAYRAWAANATDNEPALPGFQNMTSNQMFFLAYANNWCSVVRAKHYVQLIMTDVHAPSKYRAIIPLRNRPEFARAFNCPKNSPMNPDKKCQVCASRVFERQNSPSKNLFADILRIFKSTIKTYAFELQLVEFDLLPLAISQSS
ncbi:hypothetical protein PFISCL1PPCAC_2681, partial [Pristionchus fissidentatus]